MIAPSLESIEALAHDAWNAVPESFRARVGPLVFRIEDLPSDEVLEELGIDDPFGLTGLYSGVDLTQRSLTDPALPPAMVFLYRRAILDEWIERGDVSLHALVAHVLVHEIGHHFGLSDEAMDALLDSEP
ncbi:MAG: metallopeptidase family protein [Hyphomonadaceae bacterium]